MRKVQAKVVVAPHEGGHKVHVDYGDHCYASHVISYDEAIRTGHYVSTVLKAAGALKGGYKEQSEPYKFKAREMEFTD